ncbi:MAG: large subunit ribosomal protein L25 [Flavobacteriales bacterium]|jgi:large subunit ribosomal protein L25|tara:strand:+ start:730 stop:1341 length:612 start_codon:yes stop_codon:yes gene_type:complete
MKSVSVSAAKRVDLGKKEAKLSRAAGNVPCVIYGGKTNQHFTVKEIALNNLVYTPNVYSVAIDIEGTTINALIKDVQFHPVTDRILHVDFIELVPGQEVNTKIPVVFNGNAIGVMNGGKLRKTLRKLSVRATPENLPDNVTLEISEMKIGEKIYVRDVEAKNFDILTSATAVIVSVKTARGVEEEEEEEAAADAPAADAPAAE